MSNVVSVEGSVGVGNDNVGRTTADWQKIAETSAIKTHLKWMDTLELENNFLSPEVWRLDRIEQLKKDGYFTEVMLLFFRGAPHRWRLRGSVQSTRADAGA